MLQLFGARCNGYYIMLRKINHESINKSVKRTVFIAAFNYQVGSLRNKIKISNELFGRVMAVFESAHSDAGLLVCIWDRNQKEQ